MGTRTALALAALASIAAPARAQDSAIIGSADLLAGPAPGAAARPSGGMPAAGMPPGQQHGTGGAPGGILAGPVPWVQPGQAVRRQAGPRGQARSCGAASSSPARPRRSGERESSWPPRPRRRRPGRGRATHGPGRAARRDRLRRRGRPVPEVGGHGRRHPPAPGTGPGNRVPVEDRPRAIWGLALQDRDRGRRKAPRARQACRASQRTLRHGGRAAVSRAAAADLPAPACR